MSIPFLCCIELSEFICCEYKENLSCYYMYKLDL